MALLTNLVIMWIQPQDFINRVILLNNIVGLEKIVSMLDCNSTRFGCQWQNLALKGTLTDIQEYQIIVLTLCHNNYAISIINIWSIEHVN